MSHNPTLNPSGYLTCPDCPGWRAGPFAPHQLFAAGIAQAVHHLCGVVNDAYRPRIARPSIVDLVDPIAAAAARERAIAQQDWEKRADAMWAHYGWKRPRL